VRALRNPGGPHYVRKLATGGISRTAGSLRAPSPRGPARTRRGRIRQKRETRGRRRRLREHPSLDRGVRASASRLHPHRPPGGVGESVVACVRPRGREPFGVSVLAPQRRRGSPPRADTPPGDRSEACANPPVDFASPKMVWASRGGLAGWRVGPPPAKRAPRRLRSLPPNHSPPSGMGAGLPWGPVDFFAPRIPW